MILRGRPADAEIPFWAVSQLPRGRSRKEAMLKVTNIVGFPNAAKAADQARQKMANSRDRSLAISVIMPRLLALAQELGETNERGNCKFEFGNGNAFYLMPSGEFWITNRNYYTVFSGALIPKQGLLNPAQYPNEGVTIKTWLRESWQSELFT